MEGRRDTPEKNVPMDLNHTHSNDNCNDTKYIVPGSPTIAALMFSAGVVGNLVALLLLEVHRRKEEMRKRQSLFLVLVTALVVTDLLGTLFVSPIVLTSYATNISLIGLSHNEYVCKYFGFSMTFFGLATLDILLAMALERWFSIACPYFYERHITRRYGFITIPLIIIVNIIFSLLPLFNVGTYIQYCPGTWCFIAMNPKITMSRVYAHLYAIMMLFIILSVVICNVSVICHLVLMYRRRKMNQGSTVRRNRRYKRSLSMSEEVEHLVLLAFMTVAFVICSIPVVIRIYFNYMSDSDSNADLRALRFLSLNSIIDPWVFIILNPSVLRFLRGTLCRKRLSRPSLDKGSCTQPSLSNQTSLMELNKV
ncbi:prostaglandin E2 receptor EP2 subtype-like [Scleropages formosus]|uniref:Prostaglandin E2 receptor EP2 subtype n=1 Tax=Scleropages formosus TaxID=113540 RepID=A0A0P7WBF9_SCLFO|nr:prostaglandin E2 receptor EP2 subtype-like [Scleropages formosus]